MEVFVKSNPRSELTRMELKYCEHCGGLWVRESGIGSVYCDACQVKVAELPLPKKSEHRVMLPVQQDSMVDEYGMEQWELDELEPESTAGGVA